MTAHDNKGIAHFFTEEVFNKGNMEIIDEIIDPEFIHHDPNTREFGKGPVAFKKLIHRYRKAFPDLHITIEQQIMENDMVVDRWKGEGTHQGELMGMAPTGKKYLFAGLVYTGYEMVEL